MYTPSPISAGIGRSRSCYQSTHYVEEETWQKAAMLAIVYDKYQLARWREAEYGCDVSRANRTACRVASKGMRRPK